MNNNRILILGALVAALAFIGFTVFKIDIPVAGGKSAFHFANAFVVIGALVLGPLYGGLASAIGLTLADLVSGYVVYAPTTFLLKFSICIVTGLVAHKIFNINNMERQKSIMKATLISSISGMLFNIIFDPLVGFVRSYILFSVGINSNAITLAKTLAKITALTTFVNAILTVILVTFSYYYIKNALKNIYLYKSGVINEEKFR